MCCRKGNPEKQEIFWQIRTKREAPQQRTSLCASRTKPASNRSFSDLASCSRKERQLLTNTDQNTTTFTQTSATQRGRGKTCQSHTTRNIIQTSERRTNREREREVSQKQTCAALDLEWQKGAHVCGVYIGDGGAANPSIVANTRLRACFEYLYNFVGLIHILPTRFGHLSQLLS